MLSAAGLAPSQPGLYFQGNNASNPGAGVQFGDDLRCAGGSATTIDIAVKGGVVAGDVKRYRLWYRDPNGTPCGASFNLSNGVEITWSV